MDKITPQAWANRAKIAEIRTKLLRGVITYDQARKTLEPHIQHMNRRGAEIAKEHGQKFKPITLTALLR